MKTTEGLLYFIIGLLLAIGWHQRAHAEGIIATAHDPSGVTLYLSDETSARMPGCVGALSVGPDGDARKGTLGCWSASGDRITVTYVLKGATWTDDYPSSDFRATAYGDAVFNRYAGASQ